MSKDLPFAPKEQFLPSVSEVEPSFWQNVANTYRFSYTPIISATKQAMFGAEDDPNFFVTDSMLANQPLELVDELINSKSQQEFDYHVGLHSRMSRIKEQLSDNAGLGSALFAGLFDPINLIPIPTAVGMGFVKGAARVGAGSAVLTSGFEGIRAPLDPTYDPIETVFAVGGSAFFGGLLGGGIGAITASRAGKDFANATAFDEGAKADTVDVDVKGIDKNDTMRQKMKTAKIDTDTTKTLKEEGITPVEEDPNLNMQEIDTQLKKTGFGYETTANATAFGRLLSRFKSNKMGDWITNVFADGGTMNNRTNEGGVAFTKSPVNLLKGQWFGEAINYLDETRNLWLKSKGIQKPKKLLTQNVAYTFENIKSKFNKTMTYGEFMKRVTMANVKASYLGDDAVKEIPEVMEAVKVTRKLNDRARKEGVDARMFNTADNLNYKMDIYGDFASKRIANITKLKKELPNSKRPKMIEAMIRNDEMFLDKALYDLHSLERFAFSLIKKEQGIYSKIDEILEDLDIKEMKRRSYQETMNDMVYKSGNRAKKLKELSDKIREGHINRHNADLKMFLELNAQYHKTGLTDKQLTWMELLGERIQNHKYSAKQQKVFDEFEKFQKGARGGFTQKQEAFYKKMEKELAEPLEYDADFAINNLKRSIRSINKDFIAPAGEKHYTMRKYLVDVITDKRDDFQNKVILPYIKNNPSGRLAALIKAQKDDEAIIIADDDILAEAEFKEPMPKEYFKRIGTDDEAVDRVEDIVKRNNKNLYILEDGRFYEYREADFGDINTRFKEKGKTFTTTPHIVKSAFTKITINGKQYDAVNIKGLDFSDEVSADQFQTIIRQIRFIEKKYKGKVDDKTFQKLIIAKKNTSDWESYDSLLDTYYNKYKNEFKSKKEASEFVSELDDDVDGLITGTDGATREQAPRKPKVKRGSFKDENYLADDLIKIANFFSTPIASKFSKGLKKPRQIPKNIREELNFPLQITKKSDSGLTFEDGTLRKAKVTDEMIEKQAQYQATKIVNRIIGESDAQDFDGIAGRGLQKFVMHRNFDIPSYLLTKESNGIADFIELDGADIMRTYMNKFGPAVEMSRMFNGDRFGDMEFYEAINDVFIRHADELEQNPEKFIENVFNQIGDKDILLDAVLNRAPLGMEVGSATNRLVKAGQQMGQLTMMGMTTIASLADTGKVILSRGLKESFGRYFKTWITDVAENDLKNASIKHMIRFIGEGNETISNAGSSRVAEQSTGIGEVNNRVLGKVGDKVFEALDKMVGSFYNVNLLNHWTAINKRMVIPMSVDRIIRTGAMLSNDYKGDKALKQYMDTDVKILASHGLSKDDLKMIYKLWKTNGAKRGKEIYYSNADRWMEDNPVLFRKYIAAVRSDVLMTIITPTEADKPLLSYGVFKASRYNQKMKDRQHNIFKIPIQFMSWSLAANNKIVLSTLQGRHKGVASGMIAMFALGMLSDYARNPDWWKYKSFDEKMIKAVEYSGLTSYLLDVNSFAEIVSNNYVGIRPMLGSENPFTGTLPDQISEVGGPVGSMVTDVFKLFLDDSIEFKDKANMVKRLIPYNNLFYAKFIFNGLKNSIVDDKVSFNY